MGTVRLVTGNESLDLNDGSATIVIDVMLGDPEREEAWVLPWSSVAGPVLTNYVDRHTLMEVVLEVRGTTFELLRAKLEAIRNAFDSANNTLSWSPDYSTTAAQIIRTYPTPIPSPLNDPRMLRIARLHKFIPEWHFQVWRHPYYTGQSHTPMV